MARRYLQRYSRRQLINYILHSTSGRLKVLLKLLIALVIVTDECFPSVIKRPPFRIDEEGWGEFDMEIILAAIDKGGDHTVAHDLNFQAERYEAKHVLVSLWNFVTSKHSH